MNILVIDDHALFREGLSFILGTLDEAVNIHSVPDCDQALTYASQHNNLDLVLMDLELPQMHGFDGLAVFSNKYPALPVVIISASTQPLDIQRALDSGAMGYIPKNTTGPVMLNALKLVLSGGIYVPPGASDRYSQQHLPGDPQLTPRQQEVLYFLRSGLSNKHIAEKLNLAEATVKMHITAIFKAFGVKNRTQAVLEAEKRNLL